MLEVGDKVQLCGNPFDEQIAEELLMYMFVSDKIHTVTAVGKPGDLDAPWDDNPTKGKHWVKTDLIPDWTDSAWFVKL